MLSLKEFFISIATILKTKVSKTGDTMSGNLIVSRSGYDSVVQSANGTQKIELRCTTGGYRGVYDPVLQKWLIRLNPNDLLTITSPIYNNIVVDRSPSDTAAAAAVTITAGDGDGTSGASVGLYAVAGNTTRGLYSYGTTSSGGNEWIINYDARDDTVNINTKYCKRTVHSDTSDLYSETIKYSDGRLITNMRATITASCTSAGFGGYHNTSPISVPNFPVAYATNTIPTVMTTVRHVSGQVVYTLLAQNVSSRTNPGGIYVMRNSSGSGSIEVDIHAEGVWK